MNVLDLFSGIGGFSLGLERAGMRTVAFCEIEPFCQAVLRKHWPNIPIYDDVRTLTAKRLAEDGIGTVDVICGGFPCQDISVAGKGAGITGSRSGLWTEYARLIGEIRPRFVVVENVAALLGRGLGRVLGDLTEIGYDAEWHVISAADVGAPHLRERIWVMAHPAAKSPKVEGGNALLQEWISAEIESTRIQPENGEAQNLGVAASDSVEGRGHWRAEPGMGRVAHGVSAQLDRNSMLGNAVVPQIPEIIGRAIMQAEGLA